MNEYDYCSQNRGHQVIVVKDEPYLIFSCIWFKIYRIYHGIYEEEIIVWNWRRISAYRDKSIKERLYKAIFKKRHRHVKGSRRTDN